MALRSYIARYAQRSREDYSGWLAALDRILADIRANL